jgi:hypothetical protein
VDCCPHKHTNSSQHQHLLNRGLSILPTKGLGTYEHYYPYGGTAIIAGKDKTQVQQKRYRYTGKERDDSSGLYTLLL